jgi:formiminoglutamase
MSGASSSADAWWSGLEPAASEVVCGRGDPEDPRLGDLVRRWDGGPPQLRAGQPVLIGFPCDEGVRRNSGRPGAALAPERIRQFLYRLTARDAPSATSLECLGLLDLGNLRVGQNLESRQQALGAAVAGVLQADGVPVVLGGGHETAFGHYLGYVGADLNAAIINIDAHLDVRPFPEGGHSGSPFRQAFEHLSRPLLPGRYVVVGAQRQSVAKAHAEYVSRHGGRIYWLPASSSIGGLQQNLREELHNFDSSGVPILLTVDADAFRQADVPGTSAPSPVGLEGATLSEIAFAAGCCRAVRSLEIVEVNPSLDRDDQSSRWAALGIRQFLVGLAARGQTYDRRFDN